MVPVLQRTHGSHSDSLKGPKGHPLPQNAEGGEDTGLPKGQTAGLGAAAHHSPAGPPAAGARAAG